MTEVLSTSAWIRSYHQYPKGPPVSAVYVSLPVDHLWSHVLHRPTEGVSLLLMVDSLLTQSKIWEKSNPPFNFISKVCLNPLVNQCFLLYLWVWYVPLRPGGYYKIEHAFVKWVTLKYKSEEYHTHTWQYVTECMVCTESSISSVSLFCVCLCVCKYFSGLRSL